MSKCICTLEPKAIWENFYKLTQVPRPSNHEEKAREFIMNWAKENGIHAEMDEANNILLSKPATPGMENRKGVILQGHLDMVPQKNEDKQHDFTNDIFHMADLGFTELSMEPVVCAPDDPYALTKEDLPVLFDQYELLAKEMLKRDREGRGFTFYHYMIDLTGGPCIYKRISGCGSGTEYMAPWNTRLF